MIRTGCLTIALLSVPLAGMGRAQIGPIQWSKSIGGNDHYYELVISAETWTSARASAGSMSHFGLPGYLATITSAEENTFLLFLYGNGSPFSVWMGASDAAVEGEWSWVEGPESGLQFWQGGAGGATTTPFGFANWGAAEPGDSGGGEDYGTWSRGFPSAGVGPSNWAAADDLGTGASVVGYIVEYGPDCFVTASYCTAGTSSGGCVASISAAGSASASATSGFVLQAIDVGTGNNGLFFYGVNGRQASSWGNGTSYQCVVPPVKRGQLIPGSGSAGPCDGFAQFDLLARWVQKPNHHPGAGALVQTQFWYRDPQNTSNQKTALSDALEFVLCP